jgi:hypothetical protein
MTRPIPPLDLVANLALAGAAALMVVRPHHVAQIPASPLLKRGIARRFVPAPPAPQSKLRELRRLTRRYAPHVQVKRRRLTRTTGRKLNGSAALLAFSVLTDSAVEHYRGSFQNRAMYTPLIAAAASLGASLFGLGDARAQKHTVRDGVYGLAAAAGFTGLGFHLYNILKRPGGWSWLNLFYAAPIGAPMALALGGLIGRGAERVRDTPPLDDKTLLGLPAGRMLAAVTAAGLAGTIGEAGLLHFRGAYHNPAMLLPVTVPPLASAALAAAAVRPGRTINRLARWSLRMTAVLGFAGVGFHAYGVSRNMGGWRNWSQNLLNGPPLPAPPSFTGLALAGLAALTLIEDAETDV